MPLIQIFTSAPSPTREAQGALLRDLSRSLASHFGKPEKWVMTSLHPGVAMTFGGEEGPACFAAVKNVGDLTEEATAAISRDLCGRLSAGLGVPSDRVYIEFTPAQGWLWGWNGETFA
jgi:phenylpyruvate tautomerase PptA (4-oxalocrotonate tautomerase family)